ncbi:MAG: HD domain-containing protein, partial [Thermodesulfovibrionia bacterium]|nr:HD domain-containing protein [Thermodesulfovibrionia bacterium]
MKTQNALSLAHDLIIESAIEQRVDVVAILTHARGVVEVLMSLNMRNDSILAAFFSSVPQAVFHEEKSQRICSKDVAALIEGVRKLRVVDDYQSRTYKKED